MDPLQLLANPKNILIIVLLVLFGVSGGTAYYFYNKSIALLEQNAVQKRESQIYVDTHNQQLKLLTDTIDRQNLSIDLFKKTGDKQVQEMGKVQTKVDDMRVAAEQQVAELRKQNVTNLTCDQSIAFLVQQSKTLTWGASK